VALDITAARLSNQRLSRAPLATPQGVVSWLGAVQAQEYADAKWALALRMRSASDAVIERAFAAGTILRTHVLRPTWHFVAPADIRWLLALTGPRVSARLASYNRRLELDAPTFRRSRKAIAMALRGGAQRTRQELKVVLRRAGIRVDNVQRLAHIVMQSELDGVICSGARRGRQFTYALLDERVPTSSAISRDSALAELARRYFNSHGPAQLHDFVWWSGLTAADARAGLEMAKRDIANEIVNGKTYWLSSSVTSVSQRRSAFLLPLYDEYLIAYRDRSAALDVSRWTRIVSRDPLSAPIVVGGQVVGGWRKALGKRGTVAITVMPFASVSGHHARAIAKAARAYARFLGLALELAWA
jgi:hypothetical protein